jgi:hypothetical protein
MKKEAIKFPGNLARKVEEDELKKLNFSFDLAKGFFSSSSSACFSFTSSICTKDKEKRAQV